jgi:hypothetical protein
MKVKMRSTDVIRQLGTGRIVEEIQDYKRKWHRHVGRCLLNVCRRMHIFMTLLEDGILDVQEENEHNNSFSLGKGHDSVF